MQTILVRYGEISLKGNNRGDFERQLKRNIAKSLNIPNANVKRFRGQIVVELASSDNLQESLNKLKFVPGISWFTPAVVVVNDMEIIKETAIAISREKIKAGQSFGIRGKRSDKYLPFNSMDINQQVGFAVGADSQAKVDLTNPDVAINVTASTEGTYIFTDHIAGPGGLPVGSSGKILSLLSGGFDSIASSYLLAKRGAKIDFLHFHVFADNERAKETKITKIAQKLAQQSTLSNKLFFAPYLPFEMKVLSLNRSEYRYEMILFRRMMMMVAAKLAEKYNYHAVIFGDSLGQVASQTLENMVAVNDATSTPIFRPLIGMDKVEVIDLVKQIGLYEEAIAPYKDCCSLMAKEPVTKSSLRIIHEIEEKINMPEIVDEVMKIIEAVYIGDLAK
jgi:tRNA uracil 4-sulfurtransferase